MASSFHQKGRAITAQGCSFMPVQMLHDDDDHDRPPNLPNSQQIRACYYENVRRESLINAFQHSQAFASNRSLEFSGRSHRKSETNDISQAFNIENSNRNHQVHIRILDFQSSSSSEPSVSPAHYPPEHRRPAEGKAELLLNRPRLAETFLPIAAQAALTLLTIRSSNLDSSSSLSRNANILLHFGMACNVTAFLCCLFAVARKPGVATARILTGIGYIATAYGFLVIMGMLLLDKLMLWITGVACIASFPALAAAFLR